MSVDAGEDVYCTLCLSDSYLPGAAVLAKSLRDAGTRKKLACLVVSTNLRHSVMIELQSLYNYVITVEAIGNPQPSNLYLMGRPDLQYTFTKIHLWSLTQFRKIVYVDADVVALRAPDELFELPDAFAAAPDVGWPDAFNTGVMVLAPNMGEYWALRTMASAGDSFDGADQGLLNQYFEHRAWKRLSFIYNCTPSGHYQYEPAYRYYKRDISMVHFIGPDKPWKRGRSSGDSPGSFQELLSRWWAVYDRHFKVSTTAYTYGQGQRTIQDAVNDGGHNKQDPAYYATGYPVDSTQPAPPPEAPATSTEVPFTEPDHAAESIDQGRTEPQPTVEVRRFSAPQIEWDATRAAPPPQSRPEAADLAVQSYEFNNDPQPFRPPSSYPEPPRDMWYEVPKESPRKKEEKLAPIFPWEQHDRPAPTRKFVDDDEPAPSTPPNESDFPGADEFEVTMGDKSVEPKTPVIRLNDEAPWTVFGSVNRNAWDEVSGIDSYVRALTAHQRNRGKVQVLHQVASPTETGPSVLAPSAVISGDKTANISPGQLVDQVQKRRESLILTDFPTAIERPSLPVTPAPVRRTFFWGADKEEEAEESGMATTATMPPAEGVPHQADWDPTTQLEQLRRNSLLVAPGDLQIALGKHLPTRDLPGDLSSPGALDGTSATATESSSFATGLGLFHSGEESRETFTSETTSSETITSNVSNSSTTQQFTSE